MNDITRDLIREAVGILIPILATWLIAQFSGLMDHIKEYLIARKQNQAAQALGAASAMLQTAAANSAGNMALAVRRGDLDPTSLSSVKQWASIEAAAIRNKMPDTIARVQPTEGSIIDAITGKLEDKLPSQPEPAAPVAVTPVPAVPEVLPTDGSFQARAAIVVGRLMRDLSLTREQAAGIVGNLGHESGLRAINEIKPVAGRGGFGWAQWTGPRRLAFEAWCQEQKLNVTDDEANYGFLVHELQTTESGALNALRQTSSLEEATRVFEEKFERAGVVALARRQNFAEQAMNA